MPLDYKWLILISNLRRIEYFNLYIYIYTGRFIKFSVITNICNKKTKGPTLLEKVTSTGKLIFVYNKRCSMCARQVTRHTSIRYSSSRHTHASTCVHRYSSLLYRSVTLGQRGHVAIVGRTLCTKCTLHSNNRLTVWYANTQNDFSPGAAIFLLHKLASPSGRNVNYDEKQLTGEKSF